MQDDDHTDRTLILLIATPLLGLALVLRLGA
jgi:hypothetical protein